MTRLFGWPVSTVADNSCRGASTLSYSVYLWMVQCIVYPPKLLSPSDMFDVPTQRILGRPLVCGSSSKRRQLTLKSHRQRLDCPSLSATAVCDLLCKVQDHLIKRKSFFDVDPKRMHTVHATWLRQLHAHLQARELSFTAPWE